MKDLTTSTIDIYRNAKLELQLQAAGLPAAASTWVDRHNVGVFIVPSPTGSVDLRIIAAVGGGWDHVSVGVGDRCPNWLEMEHVKRLFFKDDETAFQLHVPVADHKNVHPNCLHLWRPNDGREIPMPPVGFV